MPSTYTTNLGIELPADGELDGVWGDVVNENMDILDRAINGSIALSLSGTSSTLTTSDGALSDGQYKLLVLGGTPSGTHTITISPNDAQKIYFVRNTTAQSVVFTQGSGGNVTIAAGDSAVIYSDGAGAGAAVVNITNDFAMNSVKITGGAIDGAVIGGSTAAAITGTTITATGDVTIPDKIIHAGDTNTAIRFPAADTVTVETDGAERMRIDSAGNVGIGTSSPATFLHARSSNAGADVSIRVQNDSTDANSRATVSYSTPNGTWSLGSNRSGGFILDTPTSGEALRVDSTGKLLSPGGAAFVGTVATGSTNGAIIERGSNANGEFVKYADGTMICNMDKTESRSATGIKATSITLPATYLSITSYDLIANARTTVPDNVSAVGFIRASSSTATMYINRTTTTSTGVAIVAIGRWF
jgi:hypothetical protein